MTYTSCHRHVDPSKHWSAPACIGVRQFSSAGWELFRRREDQGLPVLCQQADRADSGGSCSCGGIFPGACCCRCGGLHPHDRPQGAARRSTLRSNAQKAVTAMHPPSRRDAAPQLRAGRAISGTDRAGHITSEALRPGTARAARRLLRCRAKTTERPG